MCTLLRCGAPSLHNAPEYSRRTRHGLPTRCGVGCAELAGGFGPYGRGYLRVLARYSRVLECNGCCGAAEGPRCAVLSCAGAYVSGAEGSNICEATSVRIETEAACRTAAAAAGMTIPEPVTYSRAPRGCYYEGRTAYFNSDPVGCGWRGAPLRCAPTGARA